MVQYAQFYTNQEAAATVLAHNLPSADFCVFLTQDITAGGAATFYPRAYTSARGAANFTVTDAGHPGLPTRWSAVAVASHSLIDVGPIVDGNTRNATTQVTPFLASKGLSSYRSLHRNVTIPLTQTANTSGAITITHRLNTTNVIVFVSPNYDERDQFGVGIPANLVCYRPAPTTANTITLTVRRQDSAAFQLPTHNALYDVMVVALPAVGHSLLYHGGGDFNAVVPGVARLPSYHVGFENAFILAGGPAQTITHNLAGLVGGMLIGQTELPGILGGGNVPFVANRDLVANVSSSVSCTSLVDGINAMATLTMRGHSRVMGP